MPEDRTPLPKPNIDLAHKTPGEMNTGNVRVFFCNPVYAGLGPYPAIIDDETWVRAAAKAMREDGAEQWLVNMLAALRASLDGVEVG